MAEGSAHCDFAGAHRVAGGRTVGVTQETAAQHRHRVHLAASNLHSGNALVAGALNGRRRRRDEGIA